MTNHPTAMRNFPIFLVLLLSMAAQIAAQPASAPAPAGPINITAILEKAGQFGTLIRLMKSTQVADQINHQLSNSNSGLTIFAPTDNAFSSLPVGMLNSLSDHQKNELIQFHILPNVVPMAQFETVSNPLSTQAGNTNPGQFPLNVTTSGNSVNISTGIVNTTVTNTLYSDRQLAVYTVDKVLLPLEIFRPSVAPAPAPAKAKKKGAAAASEPSSSPDKDTADAYVAVSLKHWRESGGVVLIASLIVFWLNL